MARVKFLQKWTTIQMPSSGSPIEVVQDESGWLDLTSDYDIAIWSQVRAATNITQMDIETSPTKDDGWFESMAMPSLVSAATPSVIACI
jgi:hypothetical protein